MNLNTLFLHCEPYTFSVRILEIEDSDVIVVSRKDIPRVATCDQSTQTGASTEDPGCGVSIIINHSNPNNDKTVSKEKEKNKRTTINGENKKSTKSAKRSKAYVQNKSEAVAIVEVDNSATDNHSKASHNSLQVPSVKDLDDAVAFSGGQFKETDSVAPFEEISRELVLAQSTTTAHAHEDVTVTSL